MDIEVRPITTDEVGAFRRVLGEGFGFDPKAENEDRFRSILEFDRSFAAFDAGEVVGSGGTFSLELSVPDGRAHAAGTTMISVLPTHRRRGVLRAMMRAHLDDVRAREEPLAALWASESSIYGRFGYGPAAYRSSLRLDLRHTAFRDTPAPGGPVRLLDGEQALPLMQQMYAAEAATRPGMIVRSDDWWVKHVMHDDERDRDGGTAYRFAVSEIDGEPAGYVRYRLKAKWDRGVPDGTVTVQELIGLRPEADAALWRFLAGMDLTNHLEAWNRPVDDVLPWLLIDPRRARLQPADSLWVRIMDPVAALSARRYAASGRLRLGVIDRFCPWNEGTYELETADDGKAVVTRVEGDADVRMDIEDLGSLYLGGQRPGTLARAGRLEGTKEAITRLAAMFGWEPAPWCPEVF